MYRYALVVFLFILAVTACGAQEPAILQQEIPSGDELVVSFGELERIYTRENLEALGPVEVDNGEAVYVGVPLNALLVDAGIDPAAITQVEVTAIDGFSSTYDADIFTADTTIVAYARIDGPLAANEGNFRMVVPGQAGSMNARLVVRIEAIE
jgi:DMSO/TMAO reductase YedYZ molybdopterin-dependent catalytic subunit